MFKAILLEEVDGKVSAEDVAKAYADLGIDTDKLDPTSI